MTMKISSEEENDAESGALAIAPGAKNYITPEGYRRLKEEALDLIDRARPEVVKIVSWAASNGDRSENGDYIYGKRRLREIDRRIRFLTKRLDNAEIVDPTRRQETDQIFFGATVSVRGPDGSEHTYVIVGIDEADATRGRISWISPLARTLIKKREGDSFIFRTPGGEQTLEVLSVEYKAID